MHGFASEAAFMWHSAGNAVVLLVAPERLMYLFAGVIMGLVLGIIPGIGGLAGTAMLLPFTYAMDPYSAFALLLGLGATTATGDPIPAILFGVPGGAGSAATVLDGFPMSKKGEAGRALAASYTASLMGGVFGACLMALAIPILRPLMLYLGSPELLGFSILGISMVAILSGNAPLRGLTAGMGGIMLSMIGSDPQTGTLRWTFGTLYLWDGLPLTPALLGVFALPELCDLMISRLAIAAGAEKVDVYKGQMQGVRDALSHWWLVLRCAWIGSSVGAIPGLGAAIIDWLAYGHALKTEKDAAKTFGTGDVRGVIASEAANNAKEGGALVPTVAFGVPGSASMAILLGAFLMHGLVPGPDMLNKNLDVTYTMVWSVGLANILGAGLCFTFSPQFAKLATLRYTLILPGVLSVVYIGAFEAHRDWGDLYSLFLFGALGWVMKQFKWPRPPLVLGFVLGATIERYMFISIERYGLSWLARPVVALLFLSAFFGLVRPLLQDIRSHGSVGGMVRAFRAPRFHPAQLFTMLVIAVMGAALAVANEWGFKAKVVPMIVGGIALLTSSLSLFNQMCRKPADVLAAESSEAERGKRKPEGKIHMDMASQVSHLPVDTIIRRGLLFFGYLAGFMLSMWLIGLMPTAFFFVMIFMRLEGNEPWKLAFPYAVILVIFIYIVFDQFMAIPWPETLLGTLFPALKAIPSV
jgi:putative tricarboxylic transport membrane protein